MDCIFCKIVAKQVPAKIVYEDDQMLAFHDINPSAPIHILMIPKQHIESLATINAKDSVVLAAMLVRITQIARDLGLAEKGFRVQTNSGKDGGQVVPHLHWHLLGGKQL